MQESEVAITSTLIRTKKEWAAVVKKQDTSKLESNWDKIKKDITTQISTSGRNIVKENSLIITSLSLLYLKFINTCQTSHSERIKQSIEYFAIIFQFIKLSQYAREMMLMVACFKNLCKKEMKDA